MAVGSAVVFAAEFITFRALGETLLRWVVLARVMSPPEPCEEQPTSKARQVTDIDKRSRRTFVFQFISQRKYKGRIARA